MWLLHAIDMISVFFNYAEKILILLKGHVLKACLTIILQGWPSVHFPLSQFLP